jgi:hypothetical protein
MTTFSIAVVIILLFLIGLLIALLWGALRLAGEADDRAEQYSSALDSLRRHSSSHLVLLSGGKSGNRG